MKGFLKFLGAVAAIFTAVVGALAVFDRFSNRNAIKGEYLDCTNPDDFSSEDK
ncbi:MAG: hypothetical protein IKZ47_00940 [Clostridia bacterium]|nr:hypothetical protein [Clostridia bacterium]